MRDSTGDSELNSDSLIMTMGMRPIAESESWQEALRDRLVHRYDGATSIPTQTSQSEALLQFPNACIYWFLMTAQFDYREALILSVVADEIHAPLLSPFDTGGVATGRIAWSPEGMPPSEFVARNTFEWTLGTIAFVHWIQRAFNPVRAYWDRSVLVRPAEPPAPVAIASASDARAWTWEARLEKEIYHEQKPILHRKIVIRSELHEAFMLWLAENPGADPDYDAIELLDWLDANVIVDNDAVHAAIKVFDQVRGLDG